jgi:hypothetical protein
MLHFPEIDALAREVAEKHLAALGVSDVTSEPAIDSQGDEALRITITIRSPDKIPGNGRQFLKTLTEIWGRLEEANDSRFPIIDYATQEELGGVDDTES